MASVLRVTAEGFAALIAVTRGRAHELDDGAREQAQALADELGATLDAVSEPRTVLDLERGGFHATCWVGEQAACLLVPEQPGWFRFFALHPGELPVALLRAVGAQETAARPAMPCAWSRPCWPARSLAPSAASGSRRRSTPRSTASARTGGRPTAARASR